MREPNDNALVIKHVILPKKAQKIYTSIMQHTYVHNN